MIADSAGRAPEPERDYADTDAVADGVAD